MLIGAKRRLCEFAALMPLSAKRYIRRMYRLLATDIDDTLLAADGSLPEANRVALRALYESGVAIIFCSGRADASIRSIAAGILPLADDEYIVSFNGARVVTADSRRVVSRDYVSRDSVARIAEYSRQNSLYLQGYVDDYFLAETETPETGRYADATGTGYRIVPELSAATPDGSPKLLLLGEHATLETHRPRLLELDPNIEAMFSKPSYLEIVAAGVSKGKALSALIGRLGLQVGETVAVGDAANDVSMLRAAGIGVAVANARPEARDAAGIVLSASAGEGAMMEVARRLFKLEL